MNSKKGNTLANNRVGSQHDLNEDVYYNTNSTSVNDKKGESKKKGVLLLQRCQTLKKKAKNKNPLENKD